MVYNREISLDYGTSSGDNFGFVEDCKIDREETLYQAPKASSSSEIELVSWHLALQLFASSSKYIGYDGDKKSRMNLVVVRRENH